MRWMILTLFLILVACSSTPTGDVVDEVSFADCGKYLAEECPNIVECPEKTCPKCPEFDEGDCPDCPNKKCPECEKCKACPEAGADLIKNPIKIDLEGLRLYKKRLLGLKRSK